MNEKLKNDLFAVILVLLLSACGSLDTISAPVDTPEPAINVTESPTGIPATVPSDGLAPESPSQYIGLVYPPSPENLTQVFSMLIQDHDGYSLMMVLDGGSKMLWLSKLSHYDESGSAFWEVKDVLPVSNLEAGLTLLPDGCSLADVPDSGIFVAGRNGVIRFAWRIDTSLDRFESIPIDGIKCNSDKPVALD
ncbi:MAG TPA: hypothetical protein DCX53_10565 [Anaerolineae bacterium]|nr:hypothetical protein [Anaerolineae bacterium]